MKLISNAALIRAAVCGAAFVLLVGCSGDKGAETPSADSNTVKTEAEPEAVAPATAKADEAKPTEAEAAKGEKAAKADAPADAAAEPPKPADKPADAPASTAAKECQDYAAEVCKRTGKESETCGLMTAASELLSARTCKVALEDVGELEAKIKSQRQVCDTLMKRLCKDIGEGTESCKMVQKMTPTFPTSRCQQMTANYKDVLGELKRMEDANKPLAPELAAKNAGPDAPSWGPADAKVVLVEYSDFECPYCSQAAETEQKVKAKYGDKVRFVFRQFPLSFHKNARAAANAALEANAQGKFWEMHDKLFASQKNLGKDAILGYGKELGLDVAALGKAIDDDKYGKQIDADMELGKSVGVQGTPTLFLGASRVANAGDFDALSKLIDEKLAGAGAK